MNCDYGLTKQGCELRLQRLVDWLNQTETDAALLVDPRHVYYFAGYLTASFHASLLLVEQNGTSHIVLPGDAEPSSIAATRQTVYESNKYATLVDDQFRAALAVLGKSLAGYRSVAVDSPQFALFGGQRFRDLSRELLRWRRSKDADEIATIRRAVRACEAGYARVVEFLRPGVREIEVYVEIQAAAIRDLGEPIGELGNDFQAGSPGGSPRNRPIAQGELMPLDVGVLVRRYCCDLCRTFAVGNEPSAKQEEAARLVENALQFAEQRIRPGGSCRQLFDDVQRELDGKHGWQFQHHLGHGIGLALHEAPYLNPKWDDQFAVGDVFTLEPGLYHDELRAGVRIEQNYWLSPEGLVRLSSYPTQLRLP